MPTWSIVAVADLEGAGALPRPPLPRRHLRRPGQRRLRATVGGGGVHQRGVRRRHGRGDGCRRDRRGPSWSRSPAARPGPCTWRPTTRTGCWASSRSPRRAASPPWPTRNATTCRGTSRLPGAVGWEKYNKHHWLGGGYDDFLHFFFGRMFHEPHSTKQLEDAVGVGSAGGPADPRRRDGREARVRRRGLQRHRGASARRSPLPVTVLHGSDDQVRGLAYGERLAELTGGEPGRGRGRRPRPARCATPCWSTTSSVPSPSASPPVVPRRSRTRASRRRRRALYISSPIGLGHARRDVAVAGSCAGCTRPRGRVARPGPGDAGAGR